MGQKGCKDVVGQLADYVDGELPNEDAAHFHQHLAGCPVCEMFLDTYRRVSEIAREKLPVEVPPDVSDRLKLFLQKKRQALEKN